MRLNILAPFIGLLFIFTLSEVMAFPDIDHQAAELRALKLRFQGIVNPAEEYSSTTVAEIKQDVPILNKVQENISSEELPKEIQKLYDLKRESYSEMNRAHGTLELIRTDEERFEVAKLIIERDKEVIGCWRKINAFNASGEIPKEEESRSFGFEEMTALELVKKQGNLRTYISKYRDKEGKEEKVAEWKAMLSEIEGLLS